MYKPRQRLAGLPLGAPALNSTASGFNSNPEARMTLKHSSEFSQICKGHFNKLELFCITIDRGVPLPPRHSSTCPCNLDTSEWF